MSTDNSSNRRDSWTPPTRPDWVQRVNDEGRCMDIKSIVPLDANSLIETAKRNTGLAEFGEDDWREPFQVLTAALDAEAELNLMGRLMTRSAILVYLEARLCVEDAYKQHPEIDAEEIRAPLFIIGQGRTGTSEMLHVLAGDPRNRAMLNWEVMFPTLAVDTNAQKRDSLIERATEVHAQYERVTPEIRGLHERGGTVPCENVHMHCLCFRQAGYINAHLGQVPSYVSFMRSQDPAVAYRYEKRVLKMLQWKAPRKQWVFKSPYALLELPAVVKVYPDVRFIWMHRDPIKSVASVVNLMGTLSWVRSDRAFISDAAKSFEDPRLAARMLNTAIDWLESGALAREQICNIQFQDFIRDPLGCAEKIYEQFNIAMSAGGRAGIQKYLDNHLRSSKPVHKYNVGSEQMISDERALFKRYQEYFAVPSEI